MKTYLILGAASPIASHLVKSICSSNERSVIYLLARNIGRLEGLQQHANTTSHSSVVLQEFDLNKDVAVYQFPANINCFINLAGVMSGSNVSSAEVMGVNYTQPVLFIERLMEASKESLQSIFITTSIAGVRGRALNYVYGSAKAAMIAYASGLRQKHHKDFLVTTFIPGYMDTEMLNETKAPGFLVSSPESIAKLILRSIAKRRNVVYSKTAWRLIAAILVHVPEIIFKKMSK